MRQPETNDPLPLILLPGMADDDRLFRHLRHALPELMTPSWIDPRGREPLPAYAARLARHINVGGSCFVGGASFGGMVALEMATHLRAEACFLIASVRAADELPWGLRALRPVTRLGPEWMGTAAGVACRLGPRLPGTVAGRLRRLSEPRSAFLRWASWAVLSWRPSPETHRVTVYQIHGAADRTLSARLTRPDVVVAGAGHLLPLTHPDAVGEFIGCRLKEHRHG